MRSRDRRNAREIDDDRRHGAGHRPTKAANGILRGRVTDPRRVTNELVTGRPGVGVIPRVLSWTNHTTAVQLGWINSGRGPSPDEGRDRDIARPSDRPARVANELVTGRPGVIPGVLSSAAPVSTVTTSARSSRSRPALAMETSQRPATDNRIQASARLQNAGSAEETRLDRRLGYTTILEYMEPAAAGELELQNPFETTIGFGGAA